MNVYVAKVNVYVEKVNVYVAKVNELIKYKTHIKEEIEKENKKTKPNNNKYDIKSYKIILNNTY